VEIGKVKLRGDWQLKIRFTYTITDITNAEAKLIAREPEKEKKPKAKLMDEEGLSSDPIER